MIFLCLLVVLGVFYFRRALWNRKRRSDKKRWGFYPTNASLGNAFQHLQQFAEPHTEYVLKEKLDDRSEDGDEGGPEDPTEHLRRQLKRLRNGKRVDKMRVFRGPRKVQ